MVQTRNIGSAQVSAVGYGAMALGGAFYGASSDDEERFKVLDRLFELGCTNWDTAAIYGDSEELLGRWFARTGNRDKIFLATKCGITNQHAMRGDPEFIREQIKESLEKLQTDRVDLFYLHRTDKNIPIEITIGAMAELVKEGKVKYIGLSEASPDTIRRAHKVYPISALQVEYSPFELALEKPGGVIEVARELGITIVAYSPTGRGLATGRFKSPDDFAVGDIRRNIPKFSAENFPRILTLVEGLQNVANTYGATPAQITIAWLLAQGGDIIAIPGSKQLGYCEENFRAIDIQLVEADVARIRALCDAIESDLGSFGRNNTRALETMGVDTPPLH